MRQASLTPCSYSHQPLGHLCAEHWVCRVEQRTGLPPTKATKTGPIGLGSRRHCGNQGDPPAHRWKGFGGGFEYDFSRWEKNGSMESQESDSTEMTEKMKNQEGFPIPRKT